MLCKNPKTPPYYPDKIREVALMDDRYVSKMVFDGHDFAYLQYQYFGTLCSGLEFFVYCCWIHKLVNHC
jgi:hypothetical protein